MENLIMSELGLSLSEVELIKAAGFGFELEVECRQEVHFNSIARFSPPPVSIILETSHYAVGRIVPQSIDVTSKVLHMIYGMRELSEKL